MGMAPWEAAFGQRRALEFHAAKERFGRSELYTPRPHNLRHLTPVSGGTETEALHNTKYSTLAPAARAQTAPRPPVAPALVFATLASASLMASMEATSAASPAKGAARSIARGETLYKQAQAKEVC